MSRGALTFSETAKVMHITFACLLCKISNELETLGFGGASAHLKNGRARLAEAAGRPSLALARGPYLLCSASIVMQL